MIKRETKLNNFIQQHRNMENQYKRTFKNTQKFLKIQKTIHIRNKSPIPTLKNAKQQLNELQEVTSQKYIEKLHKMFDGNSQWSLKSDLKLQKSKSEKTQKRASQSISGYSLSIFNSKMSPSKMPSNLKLEIEEKMKKQQNKILVQNLGIKRFCKGKNGLKNERELRKMRYVKQEQQKLKNKINKKHHLKSKMLTENESLKEEVWQLVENTNQKYKVNFNGLQNHKYQEQLSGLFEDKDQSKGKNKKGNQKEKQKDYKDNAEFLRQNKNTYYSLDQKNEKIPDNELSKIRRLQKLKTNRFLKAFSQTNNNFSHNTISKNTKDNKIKYIKV